VNIRRLESLSLKLADSRILVRNPFHLLLLDAWRGDVHSQDDVFSLTHSQAGHVDVVFLRVVGQDEILKFDLDVDPLLIG